MSYLLVGVGGILGSISRFVVGQTMVKKSRIYPAGTFIVNLFGAFLLGLLMGFNIKGDFRLLIAEGFLGAFTTFSTFMYEGLTLIRKDKGLHAFIYIGLSIFLGILFYIIGFYIPKLLF